MSITQKSLICLAVGLFFFMLGTTTASATLFTGTNGPLSASADITVSANIMTIVLTNTSGSDVTIPAEVLTGVFFTPHFNLVPLSALLSGGSTVFFGSNGGGNVGGEWAYAAGLSGAPGGSSAGISSAGLGLFGQPNFNGVNLDSNPNVDGLDYGITSAGDNPATGNAEVTGNAPLIKNQVTFRLSGAGSLEFSNVIFQYGTSLAEPCIGSTCAPVVPEPATLLLLGSGLVGLGGFGWWRKRQ